ncbi:MAG: LysR family transcriptional regulator [Burkholderiales bacterium]
MDKLRAIQYFNRTVESVSFTAAARSLNVSTPAVTQLVGALERSLGVALFHRSTRGVTLTPEGERYYETSRRLAAELRDLELRFAPRGAKPRGTLRVGIRPVVRRNCVMPRIARFLEQYPDIELVTKSLHTMQPFDAENLDVAVQIGWPVQRELVVRPLAQTRNIVCASPEYWMRKGRPQEPEALRNHHCLLFRSAVGVLLDRWSFEKSGERRAVDVTGRLLSDDRDEIDAAACAGAGVIRVADLTAVPYLSSGLLVPVLTDWEAADAPMIFATYRRTERHSKLVRVFVDFLVEVFAELEAGRMPEMPDGTLRAPKPDWWSRARGRHSAYVARGRKPA